MPRAEIKANMAEKDAAMRRKIVQPRQLLQARMLLLAHLLALQRGAIWQQLRLLRKAPTNSGSTHTLGTGNRYWVSLGHYRSAVYRSTLEGTNAYPRGAPCKRPSKLRKWGRGALGDWLRTPPQNSGEPLRSRRLRWQSSIGDGATGDCRQYCRSWNKAGTSLWPTYIPTFSMNSISHPLRLFLSMSRVNIGWSTIYSILGITPWILLSRKNPVVNHEKW